MIIVAKGHPAGKGVLARAQPSLVLFAFY